MQQNSEANAREALVAKVRGYNEELYLDALTGAYNRRYYEDRIRKVKSHAGVAMIDLDDFKLYNDTLGHKVGDLVLRTVAEVIRSCIRKTDILIRYGGDEFILTWLSRTGDFYSEAEKYQQEGAGGKSVWLSQTEDVCQYRRRNVRRRHDRRSDQPSRSFYVYGEK